MALPEETPSPFDSRNLPPAPTPAAPAGATNQPSNTQQALALLAGLLPGLIARSTAPDINSQVPPELRQMMAQQNQRSAYQNPLFEAVTNQAFQGLPTYAKAGRSLSGSLGSAVPDVSGGGGGMSGLAAGAAGAGVTALLAALMKSGALTPLIKALTSGGPAAPTSGTGLPPITGAPSRGNPATPQRRDFDYLINNPNAGAMDPTLGPVFGGGSDQGNGVFRRNPR